MSEITNLLFSFSCIEDEDSRIQEVNSFVYNGLRLDLVSVDFNKDSDTGTVWYGGTRALEASLYVGAFNDFDLAGFMQHLKQTKWDETGDVQVIVKGPWDSKFRILELR